MGANVRSGDQETPQEAIERAVIGRRNNANAKRLWDSELVRK